MATTYKCDNCEETSTSLVGWYSIVVGFFHDTEVTGPPSGRVLEAISPQLVFHDESCRNAWAATAGVEPPPPPIVPEGTSTEIPPTPSPDINPAPLA